MKQTFTLSLVPTPIRANLSDDPAEILRFALETCQDGGVALATLVAIRGGAARALGSHVAIAADGRFCGYVSGGCVEAAVACEALLAILEAKDRMVLFGEGSPFFDIVLPCGGGITVAIHILKDVTVVGQVLDRLEQRQPTALRYSPERQALISVLPPSRSSWTGEDFVTVYRPCSRVVVSGTSLETNAVLSLARACGYDVVAVDRAESVQSVVDAIDPFTAVLLLHHDLDAEVPVLDAALRSPAFYVGALGGTRTHRERIERLRSRGFSEEQIKSIKAPIGLFGPTRDATSLALSVLSDVAASRLAAYG